MKKLTALLVLMIAQACTTQVNGKPCVGIMDEKEPNVKYEFSAGNIFLALLFSETLFVPALVLTKRLECPVEEIN
jgi:hypothetical protein